MVSHMPSPGASLILVSPALEADAIISPQLETMLSWLPRPHTVPSLLCSLTPFSLTLKLDNGSVLSLTGSLCSFLLDNSLSLQLDAAAYDIYISKP